MKIEFTTLDKVIWWIESWLARHPIAEIDYVEDIFREEPERRIFMLKYSIPIVAKGRKIIKQDFFTAGQIWREEGAVAFRDYRLSKVQLPLVEQNLKQKGFTVVRRPKECALRKSCKLIVARPGIGIEAAEEQ